MSGSSQGRRFRSSRAGILLLAMLLFRAYVPAGFMPASGVPFALELCPAGLAGMPMHLHHHGSTHADFESCPFGSAPGAGPVSYLLDVPAVARLPLQRVAVPETLPPVLRPQRTHQPRGPPTLV